MAASNRLKGKGSTTDEQVPERTERTLGEKSNNQILVLGKYILSVSLNSFFLKLSCKVSQNLIYFIV